jgi:hypothetical protein
MMMKIKIIKMIKPQKNVKNEMKIVKKKRKK